MRGKIARFDEKRRAETEPARGDTPESTQPEFRISSPDGTSRGSTCCKILRRFPRINPGLVAARRSADVPGTNPRETRRSPNRLFRKTNRRADCSTTGDGTGPPGILPDIGYGTSESPRTLTSCRSEKAGVSVTRIVILRRPDLRKLYAREDDEIIFRDSLRNIAGTRR